LACLGRGARVRRGAYDAEQRQTREEHGI